jgi:hypothetical protein
LEAASFHSLLGGQRRRDLKRSAAIVDRSDNIHFIVATTDLELESWSQGIRRAIALFTVPDKSVPIPTENSTSRDQTQQHQLEYEELITVSQDQTYHDQSQNQESTIIARDQAQHAHPQNQTSTTVSPDQPQQDQLQNQTATTVSRDQAQNERPQNEESLNEVGVRNARGMGSARDITKNKFNSVLTAARQKGKLVAERTKQRLAATTEIRLRTTSTDLLLGEIGGVDHTREETNGDIETEDSAPLDNRPALRERFGAAVRLARSKGKAIASNINRELQSDSVGEARPLQLRNISLAAPTEKVVMANVELRSLEGVWSFSVHCKGFDENNELDIMSTEEEEGTATQDRRTPAALKFEVKSSGLLAGPGLEPIKAECIVSLAQILKFHWVISEIISGMPLASLTMSSGNQSRKANVIMSDDTAAALGVTAVDMVQSTSRILGGIVDVAARSEAWPIISSHIAEFFEALSACPLPVECIDRFADVLQLPSASTKPAKAVKEEEEGNDIAVAREWSSSTSPWHNSLKDIFELSSLCEVELLRAENQSRMAQEFAESQQLSSSQPEPLFLRRQESQVLLNEAMRTAMVRAMEERDEAQARCVARDILHSHQLELEQRRTALMEAKFMALVKINEETSNNNISTNLFSNNNNNSSSNDKDRREFQALRKQDRQQQQESDAELMSLCQQLSSEIASRTLAELEVARLKEIRQLELESEATEKQAMQEEMDRLRNELERERQKSTLFHTESSTWRESFAEAVRIKERLPPLPPPAVVVAMPQRQMRIRRPPAKHHLDRNIHSFDG